MIIHDAFSSLKNDLIHSFFYWLTFVISSMFIFLFLVVSMSDSVGVTFVQAKGDIATNLAVFSSVLCMVEIVFANDFFAKSKSKELAVRLVCGATYVQLAEYLLVQTVFLLLLAIPLGIVLGMVCIPPVTLLMSSLTGVSMSIGISAEAVIWTVCILGFVIFWALILNLSFAYRNSAAQLLNSQAIRTGSSNPFMTAFLDDLKKGTKGTISRIFGVVMFIGPVLLFYYSPGGSLIFSIVSLLGLNSVLQNIAMPFLNDYIHKHVDNPDTVGYLGFVRHDLKILKVNLLLLIVTSVLLVTILVGTENPADTVLVLITYVAMSILLSMAILFRYSSDLSFRKKYFRTLSHIGYMEDAERKMITKEVFTFYGIVMGMILFYIINLSVSLILAGQLQVSSAAVMIVSAVLPELICMFINRKFYMDVIFKNR